MYFSAKLLFIRKSSALLSHVRNLRFLADPFQHHHSTSDAAHLTEGHRLRDPDVHCSPLLCGQNGDTQFSARSGHIIIVSIPLGFRPRSPSLIQGLCQGLFKDFKAPIESLAVNRECRQKLYDLTNRSASFNK